MKKLEDGHLQIDTAFEANILGRVAMFGDSEDNTRHIFKHSPDVGETHDELEFLGRDLKYGALVLTKRLTLIVETGLEAIAADDQEYEEVPSRIAKLCLGIMQRPNVTESQATAYPPLQLVEQRLRPEEIVIHSTAPDKTAA